MLSKELKSKLLSAFPKPLINQNEVDLYKEFESYLDAAKKSYILVWPEYKEYTNSQRFAMTVGISWAREQVLKEMDKK